MAEKTQTPDWLNECAREIGKLPSNWEWFKLEVIGKHPNTQGVMVTGAVPTETYTRGPRKGEPKWSSRDKSTERQIFVSREAEQARKLRFETETGHCSKCGGDGQEWFGWSAESGSRYRTCTPCNGTGKPSNPTSPHSLRSASHVD